MFSTECENVIILTLNEKLYLRTYEIQEPVFKVRHVQFEVIILVLIIKYNSMLLYKVSKREIMIIRLRERKRESQCSI